MKIGICNSGAFAPRWIEYCKNCDIDYKLVNVYDSDIVQQLADCDVFMWHHNHGDYKDALFAKQLLWALNIGGKKVFPDYYTNWHFDDKVGQKYLLESIGAPIVPSFVFYRKTDAIRWLKGTTFPKVFKLRGGASSANVILVNNYSQAKRLVNKAFGRGFSQSAGYRGFKDKLRKFKQGKTTFIEVVKSVAKIFIPNDFTKYHAPEKGYVYFQNFIPNQMFDIRVCVIGDKAFALKRYVRDNDFRASGSGNIEYNHMDIDIRCVEIAFSINKKLKTQSIAYDFVFDKDNQPLILEISYGYAASAYDYCEGYWTDDMQWHSGSHFNFCGWMIDNLISK